jgi:hypothetical protein
MVNRHTMHTLVSWLGLSVICWPVGLLIVLQVGIHAERIDARNMYLFHWTGQTICICPCTDLIFIIHVFHFALLSIFHTK